MRAGRRLPGVLERVAEQVAQDQEQHGRIALHAGERVDHPLHLAPVLLVEEHLARRAEHVVQVHRAAAELRPAHPTERKQIVHHLHRLGRGAPEQPEVAALAGVEAGTRALVEEPGEAAELPQRGTEVVADRRGEGLQLGVHRSQSLGALGDALLE